MKTNTHFFIVSRSVLLRMQNVSDKRCRKAQNTHFMINNLFSENLVVYEIMWKRFVQRRRALMAIWSMRIAYWIPKAIKIHSEYVIFIAFSTAKMAVWTRPNVTLHVHCLSCSKRKCHLDLSVSNWLLLLQHTSMKRRSLVGVSAWIVIRLYTNEWSLISLPDDAT